jgi:hypothetical protein
LDKFDGKVRERLRREFDAQPVHTPPPGQARYSRTGDGGRRPLLLGLPGLAAAGLAVVLLAGLALGTRGGITLVQRMRQVSPPPAATAASVPPTAAATPPPAVLPPASARPTPAHTSPPATRPSATATAGTPPPQLSDDFAADAVGTNPPAGWRVDAGSWDGVVDAGGHVVRHEATQPDAAMVAGSPRWSDYAVSAGIRTGLVGAGSAGVAGRYQDGGGGYYACGLAAGSAQLWRVKGDERQALDAAPIVSLDLGRLHTVRLEMRGSQLTCSLDGTPLLHATDSTFASGRIALVAGAGEAADFGGVRVSA